MQMSEIEGIKRAYQVYEQTIGRKLTTDEEKLIKHGYISALIELSSEETLEEIIDNIENDKSVE
jgi:acetyl-CoA carboxylase beta subunit